MLTIGAFGRATGLTVIALRHYDETGVLHPAAVDPVTGYRAYAPDQVSTGQLVRLVRQAGVPVPEVADVVAAIEAGDDIADRLRAGIAAAGRDLEQRAHAFATLLARYPTRSPSTGGAAMPEPTVTLAPLYSGPALVTSRDLLAPEFPAWVRSAYQLLYTAAGAGPLTLSRAAFQRHHGVLDDETPCRIDAVLPYCPNGARPRDLPGHVVDEMVDVPSWASVSVTGPNSAFPAILDAYDGVARWIVEHGFTFAGPSHEVALHWTGEFGSPDNRFQVGFPVS